MQSKFIYLFFILNLTQKILGPFFRLNFFVLAIKKEIFNVTFNDLSIFKRFYFNRFFLNLKILIFLFHLKNFYAQIGLICFYGMSFFDFYYLNDYLRIDVKLHQNYRWMGIKSPLFALRLEIQIRTKKKGVVVKERKLLKLVIK